MSDGQPEDSSSRLARRLVLQARVTETLARHQRQRDATLDLAPVAIVAESADLVIIVEELVDNACRYSRQGTPIQIRFQSDGVFTVTDRGRGLTPAQLSQIGAFQQFDRKQYEQQGPGLGLVLVQKLSARNGARFEMETESGVGSKATVAFETREAR